MIKSKADAGTNASNVVERNALFNLAKLKMHWITKQQVETEDFRCLPEDVDGPQLWEPFVKAVIDNSNDELEGVKRSKILGALKKHYGRLIGVKAEDIEVDKDIECSGRLWKDSWIISPCLYRRYKKETSRGNNFVMFTAMCTL